MLGKYLLGLGRFFLPIFGYESWNLCFLESVLSTLPTIRVPWLCQHFEKGLVLGEKVAFPDFSTEPKIFFSHDTF